MSNVTIYKASAGSGKTFQLTGEYLKLLFNPETSYRNILAVTFTNKATGEMRDRIMDQLYVLAHKDNSPYKQDLMDLYKFKEDELKEKASFYLNQILYNYSGFNVSTIDSFFQRIVKAFAHEIGLNSGYNVELDVKAVLEEVVDQFFDDLGEQKEAKNWLTRFAMNKMESGSSWDVQKDLLAFAGDAFNESYFALSELGNPDLDLSKFEQFENELQELTKAFIKEINALGTEAKRLIAAHGLDPNDFSSKSRGIGAYMVKFEQIKFGDLEPLSATAKKALNTPDGIKGWATATSPQKDAIQNCVNGGLLQVLEQIAVLMNDKYIEANTAHVIASNLNSFALVAELFKRVTKYSNEKNIFLLSLASPFLANLISQDDAPFVYEKTGEFLKHFMIDEFQDTSGLQWKNFYPLFLNGVSQGYRSLVVGDVKQSIYRWRSSDWQLLDTQIEADFKNYGVEEKNLEFNWRSSPNVVKFNNWCFEKIGENSSRIFKEGIENFPMDEEALRVFQRIYGSAPQKLPEKDYRTQGHVKLKFFPPVKQAKDEVILHEMVQQLLELKEKGYQPRDIAILTRQNMEGSKVAKYLMDYRTQHPETAGFLQFVSNDTVFVNSSKVIQLLNSLLQYILKPKDVLWAAKVLYFYYEISNNTSRVQDKLGEINGITQEAFFDLMPKGFKELWPKLDRMPLGDMVHELLRVFVYDAPYANEILKSQTAFIHSYQDLVLNFTRKQSADLSMFLEWWDNKGANTPISLSEEQNAIRILTIHKSKGLEYRAVFVPFANWSLDQKSKMLWCKTPEAYNAIDVVPVNYSKNLINSYFNKEYFHERLLAFVDSINMLYVALTRAEQALFVYARQGNKINSVGNLMAYMLDSGTHPFQKNEDEIPTYVLGALDGLDSIEHTEEVFEHQILNLGTTRSVGLRLHGIDYYKQDGDAQLSRLNYGKIFHTLLEDIETTADVDQALDNLIYKGVVTGEEGKEIKIQLLDAMNDIQIQDWFSGAYRVRNEATIILPNGEAIRPDRVMFSKNEIIVVDYKFTSELSKEHVNQVKNYMEAIGQIEEIPVKGYVWYLNKKIIKEVK